MSLAVWIYVFVFIIGIILFCFYAKTQKLFKCVVFTATSGLLCLSLVWAVAKFTSVSLALTPLSLLLSGLMGIPGVLFMLIFNLL